MRSYLKAVASLVSRHFHAAWYALSVIVPILVRTRARPVIFSKYGGIGDIICTFSAALELKKRHPKSVFIYNCHPGYACLPSMGGVADRVTSSLSIGLVRYWYGWLLAGFYNFASDDDNPQSAPTEVYIKDFGRAFGVTVEDAHPSLQLDADVLARLCERFEKRGINFRPLIGIHPGPSWPVREWPRENWAALIAELKSQGYPNVLQFGTTQVLGFGDVEVPPIPGAVSLINELSLEESVAAISMCDLIIGIDSGLLHIAAALGVPCVGLWGATSAHLRFSMENRRSFVTGNVNCQGCQHRHPRLHWFTNCPNDIACMKAITVEDVLSACLSRLKSTEGLHYARGK